MPKSAKKRLRSKGNQANSQFAQCNYIKLYELRIIMLLDEIRNNNDNNGNFICVFECTIVNLATYRQFTNAAWDWIIKKKKKQTNKKQNKGEINRSNRSFNMAPPRQPPGHLTFWKIIVQIPPYPGQNAVQMPHTGVHSGDQMPPTPGTLSAQLFFVMQHTKRSFKKDPTYWDYYIMTILLTCITGIVFHCKHNNKIHSYIQSLNPISKILKFKYFKYATN